MAVKEVPYDDAIAACCRWRMEVNAKLEVAVTEKEIGRLTNLKYAILRQEEYFGKTAKAGDTVKLAYQFWPYLR